MDTGRPVPVRPVVLLALALACGLVAALAPVTFQVAYATAAADDVKQYVVADSYEGKPETLPDIANRLLGSPEAAGEIFGLNVGRRQPDGDALVDATVIRPGWILVLPWDAVGPGVVRGELPAPSPAPASSTAGSTPTSADRCVAVVANSRADSNWALDLLSPARSWERTRGDGQTVAIVDSGVDGTQPQLAGRLVGGADIVAGNVRGNIDCLGSGTAVAGVIAAQVGKDGRFTGIAPEVAILPIRVSTNTSPPKPEDVAVGIEVAISAGATVLAIDSAADLGHPKVAAAIAVATNSDVVVVCAPATNSTGAAGAPVMALRVAGVGKNGAMAAAYLPGTIDVVAPGMNVVSLGINGAGLISGDGTHLAIGFAAAEAALIRAAHPQLTAAQVIDRIKQTADRQGESEPDEEHGWGMINPNAAVTMAVSPAAPNESASDRSGLVLILVVVMLTILAAMLLIYVRARRAVAVSASLDPGENRRESA